MEKTPTPLAALSQYFKNGYFPLTQKEEAALQAFIDAVEAGRVQLGLGRTFALADIGAAHELMESNAAGGKLVVLP